MNEKTKKMTTLAMISAIAFVMMLLGRVSIVPGVDFLRYDPKDVIIAIGGFVYGPIACLVVSLVVSFIEMITVSGTGPIGFLMNVISTVAFACTAAAIYRKKRTLSGAVIGLIAGALSMTGAMILWNIFITPLYMGVDREVILSMIVPTFLPFNLVKSGLNATLTMLLYKPVVTALRSTGLVASKKAPTKRKVDVGVVLVSLFLLVTCVLAVLSWKGIM